MIAWHIPCQILKRGCHEELGFMVRSDFSIIGAAGCPETNPEGLTPKGSIRRRHEYLRSDVFSPLKSAQAGLPNPQLGPVSEFP